jgi:hypothetical protein
MEMNDPFMNDHFARLSPDRRPEPCGPVEWDASLNGPEYTPYLVRGRLEKWQVDLVFTGFWIGAGTPKFFSVSVNPPLGSGDRWQFERYDEALETHGRVLAACRCESEAERALAGAV